MAASNVANDKTFANLLLKDIKETGKEFGVGAYGRVFAVDYNGVECTAKDVHPILVCGVSEKEFKFTRENFLRECQQCAKLRHPNIVQFLGIYYKPCTHIPILVMEKMDESLRSYLYRTSIKNTNINANQAVHIAGRLTGPEVITQSRNHSQRFVFKQHFTYHSAKS